MERWLHSKLASPLALAKWASQPACLPQLTYLPSCPNGVPSFCLPGKMRSTFVFAQLAVWKAGPLLLSSRFGHSQLPTGLFLLLPVVIFFVGSPPPMSSHVEERRPKSRSRSRKRGKSKDRPQGTLGSWVLIGTGMILFDYVLLVSRTKSDVAVLSLSLSLSLKNKSAPKHVQRCTIE